ncbi:MAG: 3,8-cyclase, partial [Clostridia bacterium]|nr:3,8-cyclase [Clostridia bacterium]
LTTNGQLLAPMVDRLVENGLRRVNISIDSLKPKTYKKITRLGSLNKVFQGISTALKRGLNPVKLNVVLMKGINDDEIYDFLKLTIDNPIHVRFIEYMPIDGHKNLWSTHYLPLQVVKEKAKSLGLHLNPEEGLISNETAETWRIPGGKGTIGFIHPISNPFCASCTRLRLTADGKFKPCLYWQEEIMVRKFINNPLVLAKLIKQGLLLKRKNHMMSDDNTPLIKSKSVRSMAQIGG